MKTLLIILLVCLFLLPMCGGQNSNKTPHISSVAPNVVTAGSGAFTLTVNGNNFGKNSIVRWNGADRPTVFVSTKQIQGSIGAGDIALAGAVTVAVFNYSPSGTVVAKSNELRLRDVAP